MLFRSKNIDAAESEDVISLEEIKAPPRDIKDILRVIDQTKQDRDQLEKAKRVAALPTPSSKDTEVLNHFYYRKAYAEETLGNSKAALDASKKVVDEYPSKDPILAVDELATYASFEAFRGNRIIANEALEKAKSMVPNNYRGRLLGLESNIATNC